MRGCAWRVRLLGRRVSQRTVHSAAVQRCDVAVRSRLRARQWRRRWAAAAGSHRSRRRALRLRQRRRSRSLRRPGVDARARDAGPPGPDGHLSRSRLFRNDLGRQRRRHADAALHRCDRAQRPRRDRLWDGCGDRRLRQRRLDRSLRHEPRAEPAVSQQRRRHVHRRHRRTGTDDPRWSTSATFFDYDRDGWLDLFVANYVDFSAGHEAQLLFGRLRPRLLQSRRLRTRCPTGSSTTIGNGTFTDVVARAGDRPRAGTRPRRPGVRTSTATAGPICTSPTTAIRTSCGSTRAGRACSRTTRCWQAWR